MIPTVEHPTDRPNFSIVDTGKRKFAFSYETCVAISKADGGWLVRENIWGPTSGKHLNWLDGGNKHLRVPYVIFQKVIDTLEKEDDERS